MKRRTFLASSAAAAAGGLLAPSQLRAQSTTAVREQRAETSVLSVAYEERGNPAGVPVVMLHGFPDDVRAWDGVAEAVAAAGHRVLVPYLRGYGPTHFREAATPRLAEQAAIAQDLVEFADALRLPRFVAVGYDWGGRAACIAAALHPDRVRAAVLIGGYSIQNTIAPSRPAAPAAEQALWYQWYFNTERGRAGLAANRRPLCRLLWQTWSPTWHFTDEIYDKTALSFDNPDFVDVVIHSYRHRNLNAPGDPRFADVERQLAARPKIEVPSIVLYGAEDGVARPSADSTADRAQFVQLVGRRIVNGAGHFLPREKPGEVSSAVLELLASTK
jgi:pimeloyl-ACP methyl ester carboxylesterase